MVEIIIIECYFDIMCGMDFSEMIRQRYSVRKYDSRPVIHAIVLTLNALGTVSVANV